MGSVTSSRTANERRITASSCVAFATAEEACSRNFNSVSMATSKSFSWGSVDQHSTTHHVSELLVRMTHVQDLAFAVVEGHYPNGTPTHEGVQI